MKRKFSKNSKRSMAIVLSAAMMLSGLTMPVDASAKQTQEQEREDNTIVYAVDCGDINPETAPEDGPLGTRNSVTDQIYGEDAVTGYEWGVIDDVSTPLKNGTPNRGKSVVTDNTWPCETEVQTDQTSKTATNRYTRKQIENGIDPRYIDYGFELDNGDYIVEVGFANPWSVSNSPSVYANYGESDEQTIGENITETSVTKTVTVSNGKLTINARGTGMDNQAVNITYITIRTAGDEAIVQRDYDELSVKSSVTSDIKLPTEGSSGSKITWTSDNEAVISKDGKVTRPAAGQDDATVTLTAEISYGEAKKSKEFKVTVTAEKDTSNSQYYNLDEVEVTDDYYDNALELDAKNLLALDEDRLLAGFRETAGYASGMSDAAIKTFMKDKSRYGGGWENSLIGGHTLGHYMSAVAQGVVNPGLSSSEQQKLKERLDSIVSALKECQDKTKGTAYEGFIFGATLTSAGKKDVDVQFDNVENGKTNISTEAWVPWYTMHKILAGLVDAYEITGNEEALEVANNLATWIAKRVNAWSASTQKMVLSIEYGGMNDALYELYKVTDASNKEEFKKAAHQFDETSLFEAVSKGTKNVLNGKHANVTIPKFLGALCRYEVDNSETEYLQYAEDFWDMVINNHTYITGGNSEDEHFGADNVLNAERTNVNNETCNTYNMLKLTRRLFAITGEKKYADYYENTLINAIMSSQDHETGLTMYFQPMASGYQKVFGTLENSFWCCTGSGMENFTKLQDSIYFKGTGVVGVNLYLASTVKGDGYTIEQTGDLSTGETMTFKVSGDKVDFKMKLRVPDWVKGDAVVKFGDETYDYKVQDGYIVIPKDKIADGATFTVTLPMEVRAENLPDSENTYAFKYGPFVLSAKLGTDKQTTGSHGVQLSVPTTKAVSSDSIGIQNADSVEDFIANINDNLVKEDGSMNFTLTGTNVNYTFTTHYNQDKENYGIYWTYYVDEDGRGAAQVLEEKESGRLADTTVDKIEQVGRGQYEIRFTLTDDSTDGLVDKGSVGKDAPDLTRQANAGGSFGYKMEVIEGEDNYLLVTYAKEDDGKPIKITVGDTVIADEVLNYAKADVDNRTLATADQENYYQVLYKIPASVVAANVSSLDVLESNKTVTKRVITVMFAGTATEASARICKSVAMMKAYRTANELTKVTYKGQEVKATDGKYEITVPYTETPEVTFEIKDSAGYVTLDGTVIDEKAAKKIKTTAAKTEIAVAVYAQDFKTVKEYTLVINKDYTGLDLKDSFVKGFAFDDDTDGAVAVSKSFSPSEKANAEYKYEDGVDGKALTLSGSYGLKLLDDASVLGNSYTISFWMNPKSVGATYDPTLTAGTFSPEYWLNLTLDGKLWSSNGAWVTSSASNAYTAGEWQHVTVVVDGSQEGTDTNTVYGELYVNGELVNSGNVAKDIMTKSKAKVYFGVNAWDAIFKGAVDEILMFNKALSSSEVQALAGKAVTAKTLSGNSNSDDVAKPEETQKPSEITTTTPETSKKVTVKAAGYTLAGNKLTLVKGKKVKLVSNAASFKTSKKTVASVSAKGVVTAKKAGTAKITLKYGTSTKTITVKVVNKAKKNKKLALKKTKLSLKKGKTAAISIKKMTAGTTDTIRFKTSKKKVATVDAYGVVKAKKKGKAVITVICGKVKKKVKVTVK